MALPCSTQHLATKSSVMTSARTSSRPTKAPAIARWPSKPQTFWHGYNKHSTAPIPTWRLTSNCALHAAVQDVAAQSCPLIVYIVTQHLVSCTANQDTALTVKAINTKT